MESKRGDALTALFVAILVLSNILSAKLITIGPVIVPGGIICYAITFLISDVLNERYGKEYATRAMYIGLVAQIISSALIALTVVLPGADGSLTSAFDAVMGTTPWFVTRTVFYDSILYLGTPTRANYRFLGWYYNGTKVESNTKWKYAEDITLVAEWEFIGTEGLTFSKIDGRDAYSVGFGTKATEASEVIIPDTYNGMPVVKMSSPMFCEFTKITLPKNLEYLPRFQYCYNLREIVIPKTVTETAHNAFSGCSSLQNITFENGGTALTLGVQIFQNCTSLSSITLPDHLTDIGLYPFDGCSSLSSINVSDNATNFKSVDGVLYSKDMKTIYVYPPAKLGATYTLDGVSKIFDGAFDSYYLTTLNIKNFGISFNIGNVAFSGCTQLTTINFYGTEEQLGFSQHAQVSSSITINYLG